MAATYPITGVEGTVTSWTNYSTFLNAIRPNEATIEIFEDEVDVTGLNATTSTGIAGLRQSQGTVAGFFGTGRLGSQGLVALTSGYDEWIDQYTVTVETIAVHDYTSFQNATWRSFRPDRVRVSGTFSGKVDENTALTMPTASTTAGGSSDTLTLTYGDSSADETLSGSCWIRRLATGMRTGDINRVTYAFEFTGNVTAAGTGTVFTAGVLGVPTWTWSTGSSSPCTLTLTATATSTPDRTYAVDAFARAITIDVEVGRPVLVTANWVGSGAVTVG